MCKNTTYDRKKQDKKMGLKDKTRQEPKRQKVLMNGTFPIQYLKVVLLAKQKQKNNWQEKQTRKQRERKKESKQERKEETKKANKKGQERERERVCVRERESAKGSEKTRQ